MPLSEVAKEKQQALYTREPVTVLNDAGESSLDDDDKFPLDELLNDLLVSVLEAAQEQCEEKKWARCTVPLVCKAWNELYRTKDSSPLHKTLELDFVEEIKSATALMGGPMGGFSPLQRRRRPPHDIRGGGVGSSPPCPRFEGHLVGREERRLGAHALRRGALQ